MNLSGKSHFLSLRLLVHGKPHKVVAKQLPAWDVAVNTADKALLLNPHERQVCFNHLEFSTLNMQNADEVGENASDKLPDNSPPNFTVAAIKRPGEICSNELAIKKVKLGDGADGCKSIETIAKATNKPPRSKKTKKAVSPRQPKLLSNKQANKVLAKHFMNKLDDHAKSTLDTLIKKQGINNHVAAVNHTPTSLIQSNINPETGKRKRGRPRKNPTPLISHNKNEQAVTLVEKPEMQKHQLWTNNLPNHLTSPAENEKSDDTSDTNSISGLDTEGHKSSKAKDYLCAVCEKPDNLIICEGICNIAYHKECLGGDVLPDKFICDQCMTGNHVCFICRKKGGVIRCCAQNCSKFYHLTCIKTLDSQVKEENFICPLHRCNVCETTKTSVSKRRLSCCVRCPVAYHTSTCIVAGSVPLNSQYLVCNRHFVADPKKAHHLHVNVNWCFVCSIGGTLICCESCPAAFHAECIQETGIPEGHFFCRDCKDGKEMLYGEIVWVKLGMYR